MGNQNTEIARKFHDRTKYGFVEIDGQLERVMGTPEDYGPPIGEQSPHNEPHPFKVYAALDRIALPRDFDSISRPLLDAIAMPGGAPEGAAAPDRASLARICLLSNGILKRGSHGTGRVIEYRAAGGTGARYHLELYIVCGELADLDAGVYHYAADTHELRPIRSGDYRAALVEATGEEPSVAGAPALLVATSTFWRNAWRYLERAYRHTWWDLGTTLANVLAVAAAEDLRAKVVMGFVDGDVNQLLDIDGQREAAVCIVPLGSKDQPVDAPEVASLNHAVEPVSTDEIDFPRIWEMHAESSLTSNAEVAAWRTHRVTRRGTSPDGGDLIPLQPRATSDIPDMPVDEAIRRRRSTRHYDVGMPIPFESVSTMIDRSMRPIAFDCFDSDAGPLIDPYLIVNNVDGLDSGAYAVRAESNALKQIAAGNFREQAAAIAVGQQYAADAHVNAYFLVDLEPILDAYGNRGYRIAQLEGALRAGKIHLAAHTLGLGAVGSTSLDDEVIRFFSPHAAGKDYMFVMVFGKRRRRRS